MTAPFAPRLLANTMALAIGLALCLPAAAQTATSTLPGASLDAPGQHTLSLQDADMDVLIQTVSEITGRSFIVDPRVEGKVTVISSKPMGADEVWTTFASILRVHGYAVVPAGNMWKVLPEAAAASDGGTALADGPEAIVTRVVEVRQVSATELATILGPLVPASGKISAQGSNLVITDRSGNVERLTKLIARIDTASGSEVEVIALRHANAAEVARTLAHLDGTAPGAPGPKLVADERSNSILLSGDHSQRLRLRTLVAHLDTPLDDNDNTQVIYLRNASAKELVPVLTQMAATLTNTAVKSDAAKSATIDAHEETNSLVITAAPAVFRQLASVVRQLDVRRAQVMVEAVIAEVTDELADELGVQWQSTSLDNRADGSLGSGVIGGTNFPGSGGLGGIIGAATNPLSVGSGLNLGYVGGTLTLPGPDGNPIEILQVGALIRALRSDGRANILSRPSVITLDNQMAQLKVTQEVPFLTGSFSNTGSGGSNPANPFQTIERKDVGLILKVTPHVNEGDSVRLEITQEVSSLSPSQVAGAVDLITNKREIDTTVQVPDGAMLVLGGLTSEEVGEAISGVPGLSRIPLLGNLFKSRKASRSKRNLMIFLRPVILRDAAAEASVSNEKYNYLRAEQLQLRERMDGRVRGGGMPILPEDSKDAFVKPAATPAEPVTPAQ